MIVSSSQRLLAAGLALVTLLLAPPAGAEASADEAARHFERALAHADALDFDAALSEFRKAYELSPHYSVNYNIGLACAASGRAKSAVLAFERYLGEGGAEVPPERRTRVTALIKTERAKIARIVLDVQPKAARVLLDGQHVSVPPEGLELDPGNHELLLSAPGHVERRFGLSLRPGESTRVSAALDEVETRVLELRCAVPDVALEIDGKPTRHVTDGTTPLALTLPPQARELGLRRTGYRVELVPLGGATATLDCRMAPLAGARTARLVLRLRDAPARVLVDGAPFHGEHLVPGLHTLRVERGGFTPYSRSISLSQGQTLTLDVELVPTAGYRQSYESRAKTQRYTAYGVGLAGLGAAVGAAVTAVYSNHLYGEWKETQAGLPPPGAPASPAQDAAQADNDERKSCIQTLDRVSVGLGVASTLLVGTAVWLYLDGDDPHRYGKQGGLAVGLSGSTFAFRGAF